MPKTNPEIPVWQPYAHKMITRLRRHHGVTTLDDHKKSELDHLFDAYDDAKADDIVTNESLFPSRHVPARDVLTAIRLAATLGDVDAENDMRQCGALTVIRDVAVEDVGLLKDVLAICFPRNQLTAIIHENVVRVA